MTFDENSDFDSSLCKVLLFEKINKNSKQYTCSWDLTIANMRKPPNDL